MRYGVDNLLHGDISRPYVNSICHALVKQQGGLGEEGRGLRGEEGERSEKVGEEEKKKRRSGGGGGLEQDI